MITRAPVILVFALLLGAASAQTSKKPPAPPAHELVLQGKVGAAVSLALKAPDGAASTLKALLDRADAEVTERQIAEAKATLAGAGKFLDECAKRSPRSAPPREALEGRRLRLEGIELSDQKEYAKAEGVLRKALETSRKIKDTTLEAGVRNNLGHTLRLLGKDGEAVKELTAARDIAEANKDLARAGSYNFNLGLALYQSRRFEPAFDAFKRSAEQNQTAGKTGVEARALLWQGRALSAVNSVSPEPIKYLSAAQKLFEKLGDSANLGWCYYYMGDHTAYSFKFKEAAVYGEAALVPFTKAADKEGLRRTYNFLVDMYGRLNEAAKVEMYRKKALEIASPQGGGVK